MKSLNLSFRYKLLLFWLGSMLVVLTLVGAVYYYQHTTRLENTSMEHIGNAFVDLNAKLDARKTTLLRNVQIVADEEINISILSMIDTYQDIENYQPLVFDPEKQTLALDLTRQARAAELDLLAAHDGNSIITSFYVNDRKLGPYSGYQSYRDGVPVTYISENAQGDFLERKMPPTFLKHAVHAHTPGQVRAALHEGHRGIFLETFMPLVRLMPDNSNKVLGTIHAGFILDERLLKDISIYDGLAFAILLPNGTRLGNLEVPLLVDDLSDAPPVMQTVTTAPSFKQIVLDDYLLGAVRMPLSDGQQAYFVFAKSTQELISIITPIEEAIFITFVVAGLVFIPLAAAYMNRTFTMPIENLLKGVEHLRGGGYKILTGINGVDELSSLAQSFNAMQDAIKVREKALRESEERFRALAYYTPNKLHIKDLDGRYVLINKKSEELFGISNDQAVGKTTAEIFPNETSTSFDTHDQIVLHNGKPVEQEETFTLGNVVHTYLTVKFPILGENGEIVATGGSGYEITERKRAEVELVQHRDHLSELVKERTAEVEEKAKQLELALLREKEFSALQKKFVSLVSHEFRTPLTIIDGTAQRMLRRKDIITADELETRAQKVRSAVTRMIGLIDTTLYASSLDEGKIELKIEACDIRSLLTDICDRHAEISPDHQIKKSIKDLPDEMMVDPRLIDQVFTNLFSNAVKYAPGCPLIEVKGWRDGNNALISITDQGVGIPKADLPYMFQRFFRAKTSEGFKGTGIGLSVCMEFVQMHGGDILIDSIEGEGSTFTVRLPIT